MNRGDVTAEVVEHLFIVVEHLREGFDRAAAGADLSAGQAKALRHLAAAGPVAMRDLASRMHCDASNITGIVDRLEARGLVVRRVADGDRRVKSLVVTADGRRLAEAMWRQVCEQAAAVLELTEEESTGFALLLRRAGTRCAVNGACAVDGAPAPTRGRARRPAGGRADGAANATGRADDAAHATGRADRAANATGRADRAANATGRADRAAIAGARAVASRSGGPGSDRARRPRGAAAR